MQFSVELSGDADEPKLTQAIAARDDVAFSGFRGATGMVPAAGLRSSDDLPHKCFSLLIDQASSDDEARKIAETLIEDADSPHSVLRTNRVPG